MTTISRVILAGLAALALAAPAAPAPEAEPATRATMDAILEDLQLVFPLSVSDGAFGDPAHRAEVEAALQRLAAHAVELEQRGHGGDATFGFLVGVLARDLRLIQRRYESGRVRSARFMLLNTVETCVTCHARLPSGKTPAIGARFLEAVELESLALDERAKLEAATRQFDAALTTYERIFAAPELPPADTELTGGFVDYLEICIRVENDPQRASATLARLSERPDLPESLRRDVAAWLAALQALRAREPAPDEIAEARALVAEAEALTESWYDSRALVHYIAASSPLYRYVDSRPEPGPRLAETYYLLGVIESRIGRSAWLSQAEPLLEAAIRTAPHQPVAERAYALLEELLVAGYTGSAGQHVPPDVTALLGELEKLAEPR